MSSENKIVYISDGSGVNLAKKEKKITYPEIEPSEVCLKIRLEKKGRGGKSVTVIYEVPNNPPYFKKLLKAVKNVCGCGGSLKDDQMEIQGDKRAQVKKFLEERGFQVKGN